MRCPNANCRQSTNRLIVKFTKEGKKVEGCPSCVQAQWDRNVRTGKKIWAGTDVDGVERNREKIHAFGEKIKSRAERMRKFNPFREGKD